ncbi:Wzz/FepE/Etk N-terminal domain-containing protein [Phyllobacterium myrsinacearum]|uniref:Capsular polysaccharide transport system permease protein n=1 Tax=Phyllobacterium myrsinacearum TaxID=28101 RepID=A0A839EGL3_9HYPH|nr:Wzz/FepE/Etk N-terminal domain-containing protein [Phyllobacterium myrsinacearum]MBA8879363.1 capsular polysaccharide transport system permease protein [Phyllobacterium myrsinacearum]
MTRLSPNDEFLDYMTLVDLGQSEVGEARKGKQLGRLLALARRHALLILMVILPTTFASVYYGVIASPQYASETRFVVRSPNRNAAGMLSGFLQSTGFVRAQDDSYVIMEYIESRAALTTLEETSDLRAMLSRPEADFLTRFPRPWGGTTEEALYKHYLKIMTIDTDSSGGVTTLQVRASRPDDAQKLTEALLVGAETLINQLNERARQDAIRYAKLEVADSEGRMAAVQKSLTDFRNKVAMVDPSKQSAVMLDMIARLSDDVAKNKAQYTALIQQAPQSPQIQSLRSNIDAMETQISTERARIVGGDASMAPLIAQYEQLLLQRELGMRMLESSATSLENAKIDAQRQQLYLERIVNPNRPDYALYPKRLYSVLLLFALCFSAFWIVRFLLNQIYDHAES